MTSSISAGQRIDHFVIESQLGSGGMGTVYIARDTKLGRQVAIKFLHIPPFPDGKDLFSNEITLLAKLDHPNIARIYETGDFNGLQYMALKYIDGVTLDELITSISNSKSFGSLIDHVADNRTTKDRVEPASHNDNGNRTISREALCVIESESYITQCCRIIVAIAEALQHAHRLGIVHRDVKPSNIMLDKDGNSFFIDFSISCYFDKTTVGFWVKHFGTVLYMSPEQAIGSGRVGPRSDTYSLGVVLHELLTLEPPNHGGTAQEIRQRIVTKELLPASWLNRAIPRSLESIVHKATHKDPDQRYDASGLAEDLKAFLRKKSVKASRYIYKYDASAIAAERPAVVYIVLALVIAKDGRRFQSFFDLFFRTITRFDDLGYFSFDYVFGMWMYYNNLDWMARTAISLVAVWGLFHARNWGRHVLLISIAFECYSTIRIFLGMYMERERVMSRVLSMRDIRDSVADRFPNMTQDEKEEMTTTLFDTFSTDKVMWDGLIAARFFDYSYFIITTLIMFAIIFHPALVNWIRWANKVRREGRKAKARRDGIRLGRRYRERPGLMSSTSFASSGCNSKSRSFIRRWAWTNRALSVFGLPASSADTPESSNTSNIGE